MLSVFFYYFPALFLVIFWFFMWESWVIHYSFSRCALLDDVLFLPVTMNPIDFENSEPYVKAFAVIGDGLPQLIYYTNNNMHDSLGQFLTVA